MARAKITEGVGNRQLPAEAEAYLDWLAVERGRAVNTLAAYRRDLLAYNTWLTEHDLSLVGVSEMGIQRYVVTLRTDGKAASSSARALVTIRNLHKFMALEGHADHDPAADVAAPRIPAGLPKALTEIEIESLLGAVTGNDPIALRDRAILEVLYGCGMRISELCGLSESDLDLENSTTRVFGKGSKERVIPIGRMARNSLMQWLSPAGRDKLAPARWKRRDDSVAIFLNQRGGRLSRQGAWAIVTKYGDQIGLGPRLTPHVLRHSCATHMLDHGADIRAVQELLGHASISTTQIYTHVSATRLRSVYEQAHPRAMGA